MTSAYRIQTGVLKGLHFGGSLRYRDKTVATPDLTNDPILGPPGLFPAGSTITFADVTRPIIGGSVVNTDAVLGSSTTIFEQRVGLNMSLNVRNVLNNDKLIAQSGLSGVGSHVVFQYPEPRVFVLMSSFDFGEQSAELWLWCVVLVPVFGIERQHRAYLDAALHSGARRWGCPRSVQ